MSRHQLHTPPITFSRAADSYEFEGAFRCLYTSYFKRGLAPRINNEMRLTRYHLLPTTSVFIARQGDEVVGTLSMVEDAPLGVPMRSVFDAEVKDVARSHHKLVEATCLAVSDAPLNGLNIVNGLIGMTIQSAARRGISRILIAVHPRHAAYYVRAVGLREFASVRPYPSVGGLPAVGLVLNLDTWFTDHPAAYRKYFGMVFPPSALSHDAVSPTYLQRLAALWQCLHGGADDVATIPQRLSDDGQMAA
jgi:hypothetical protein